jgi:hypothetical protein
MFDKLEVLVGNGVKTSMTRILAIKTTNFGKGVAQCIRIPVKYITAEEVVNTLMETYNGELSKDNDSNFLKLVTIYDNKQEAFDWLESLVLICILNGQKQVIEQWG